MTNEYCASYTNNPTEYWSNTENIPFTFLKCSEIIWHAYYSLQCHNLVIDAKSNAQSQNICVWATAL